jgi:hypothetical protein
LEVRGAPADHSRPLALRRGLWRATAVVAACWFLVIGTIGVADVWSYRSENPVTTGGPLRLLPIERNPWARFRLAPATEQPLSFADLLPDAWLDGWAKAALAWTLSATIPPVLLFALFGAGCWVATGFLSKAR